MIKKNRWLEFLIVVLFLTDSWVFVYKRVLAFLNFHYPPAVNQVFIVEGAYPEPFEIPLYLILTFLFTLAIYFFRQQINEFIDRLPTILKYTLLVILAAVFIHFLGGYPMKDDIYPYFVREPSSLVFAFLAGYLALIFFFIIQLSIIGRLLNLKEKISWFIFSTLIILTVALLTFEPKFPFSWHDAAFFFGPILEIAHGKSIFTQIQSQYGFLSVLFLTVLYKLKLFSLAYLPAFIWFLYIIEYYLCFYLIFSVSQSVLLGLLGLFSIITINYFSLYHLPIMYPQIGPMRWLPLVILSFLFYKIKKIESVGFIFILSLLSYWVIDAGLAILFAYELTLFLLLFTKTIDLKRFIKALLWLSVSLISIFLAINYSHLILGYQSIDPILVFTKLKQYSQSGFGMLPIEPNGYFWLVIFLYLASIISFFGKKNHPLLDQLLLLVANFSFFLASYYVGRSHPHNLFNVATLPLLNLFVLIGIIFPHLQSAKIRTTVAVLIAFFLIVQPAWNRRQTLTKMVIEIVRRYQQPRLFQSAMDDYLNYHFAKEKVLIRKYLKNNQVLIISTDDTYFLYLTNKASLLKTNPLVDIISKADLNFALEPALRLCPKTIAVDCQLIGRCPTYTTLGEHQRDASLFISPLAQHCHFQYRPVECTNQLCILAATR